MTFTVIRLFFLLASALVGIQLGSYTHAPHGAIWGGVIGCTAAGGLVLVEWLMHKLSVGGHRISTRGMSAAVFGLIFGLLMSKLLGDAMGLVPMDESLLATVRLVSMLVLSYLGVVVALRGRDEFNVIIPYVRFTRQDQHEDLVILDTSVVIDGRIADICQTKFLQGRLIVPRFVLRELQAIADSADPLKRNRGRRGLDILNRLRKAEHVDVRIHEEDFPGIAEVDSKLVKLAKLLDAKVLTNDYNLNKIAEVQGVTVLNINELANALRPVVLPGEALEVKLIKEGKEYNQGVAYLEDGTMVVVDNGRYLIGQAVRILVTSVLQTSAGRMIFARPEHEAAKPPAR
ncbi:MAG: hypothetical protein HY597_03460 [Candidatus Omnitrophica bacterium]|nr:hypothetical protein [Candidatus Omnitrophota bacterium]